MKLIKITLIPFIGLTLPLTSCTYRDYDFEYVKFEFNDGSKKIFENCSGAIIRDIWSITKNRKTYNYPLSDIKSFDWKYTTEDLRKQKSEIRFKF